MAHGKLIALHLESLNLIVELQGFYCAGQVVKVHSDCRLLHKLVAFDSDLVILFILSLIRSPIVLQQINVVFLLWFVLLCRDYCIEGLGFSMFESLRLPIGSLRFEFYFLEACYLENL